MNFYGLETEREDLVCSWVHPPEWYMERLRQWMGINSIRLPFSYQYVNKGNFTVMDKFIEAAARQNMNIILDYHRTWSTHQGPTPEEGISLNEFIATWIHLLTRYQSFNNVYGIGSFNEIQRQDPNYTKMIHQELITAVEAHFPDRFEYFLGCPVWSGDCSEMKSLQDLPMWNRIKIDVHKYVFSGNSNKQEWDYTIPRSINESHWFVGETGWRMDVKKEVEWGHQFIDYLVERNIRNVCLWTIAHSGDTSGWWQDDCETFQIEKARMALKLWNATMSGVHKSSELFDEITNPSWTFTYPPPTELPRRE